MDGNPFSVFENEDDHVRWNKYQEQLGLIEIN